MASHGTIDDDYIIIAAHAPSSASAKATVSDSQSLISDHIDHISKHMRRISLDIHDHPETSYKEVHAHAALTTYLSGVPGWDVECSAYGIDTAFVAVFNSGKAGPVVSFNAEYDALQGIGHACGHNLIAVSSLAAALATAHVVELAGLGGKVVLFGTPAEEGGGGKIKLLNAGAYSDHAVDVSIMAHPGTSDDAALVRTAAYTSLKVEYHGKEAHAAARPWDGINALDALVTAYNAIAVLRQQTQPGDIIQMQITNGGLRPNIIHAYASGQFVVRSSSQARLDALVVRVKACFEAGATATGATLKVTQGSSYKDHVPNAALGRTYRHFWNQIAHIHNRIPEGQIDILIAPTQASTDQGDISHAMPSLHAGFWIRSEGEDGTQLGGPHTPDFAKAAATEEAHGCAMQVAIALAATAVEVLVNEKLLEQVKREFRSSPTVCR
ncbi:hypothetical protein B0A48_16673 [Cryoendolithus antarcticus]|uniref:Peptidase M20 domain-containing protein 2 n=1 Tax=Cryoendolithus antarcticus TaxID=1507870 RepID=A0A1V8SEX0_9PEZI|nr:hypothetical protein B0A48_16673 [Cryoendolithus antarcticus]